MSKTIFLKTCFKPEACALCQVKKAVQALQAFLKTTSASKAQLLDDSQPISLLFTLWRIPKKAQTIRMWVIRLGFLTVTWQRLSGETDCDSFSAYSPLPNAHRTETDEVCLFVKDEPKMTSEQTQRFYKNILEESGVKCVSEVHY